jgi:hypothetical protein
MRMGSKQPQMAPFLLLYGIALTFFHNAKGKDTPQCNTANQRGKSIKPC